jgi:hypothetical protein
MSRRLILVTPVLLIAGIVVQVTALVLVVILWIPCLIWPSLINWPYQRITTAGARLVARAMIGRKTFKTADGRRVTKAETAP